MADLSKEEYKKLSEELLEKYKKLDYIASGNRATDRLNETDPMREYPSQEEIFGNPDAEIAQNKLIEEYNNKGVDAGRVVYLNELEPRIEVENNIPKGSISKLGLALDPIAEGLEFALKGIGLGSVAQWWVKAEAANFLAGLIRGAGAASGVAQLGQSQALMGEEFTADADAIKNAFAQNLSSQMKLSPSLWMENKYAESDLGKGKTPSQQGYEAVKNALKLGK
ncbi:hypothetical protein N8814_05225 [Acidimicrobiia bacterium]|nr:hypothetical protein [Acidimicrobiia bacterium]